MVKFIDYIIGYIVALILSLIRSTYRFTFVGIENKQRARAYNNPQSAYVVAFLHEHLFGIGLGFKGQHHSIMVSLSKDGEIASVIAQKLGYYPVRGSSSRGGRHAKEQMLALLLKGIPGALTIDGPRGPRRVCHAGIVDLAKKGQVAILPIISTSSNPWILKKSWDKFKIPKPFSRIIIRFGRPITVPADTKDDAFTIYQQKVIEELEAAEKLSDQDSPLSLC